MHSNCRLIPDHILWKITHINNIKRADTFDPALKLLNEEITSGIQTHKQSLWKEHLYAHWDHRHNTHINPIGLAFLTSMLNTALNTNIIPHIWKLANIIPFPKPNKDIDKGTSYRPVSLLSVIAKALEKSLLPYITANILQSLSRKKKKCFETYLLV